MGIGGVQVPFDKFYGWNIIYHSAVKLLLEYHITFEDFLKFTVPTRDVLFALMDDQNLRLALHHTRKSSCYISR